MKLFELATVCNTKDGVVGLLQQHGIIPVEKLCSNGHSMKLQLSDKCPDRWRCQIRTCREDVPIRKNNWLENSRLPYRSIVLFCYCWAYEISTVNFCQRELSMSPVAFVDWSNYLREVCASSILRNFHPIGGPNKTVEIDESMFSRRKNNTGQMYPQQWVFGGVCRETADVFLYAVPDRSSSTLIPIIKDCILPGSTIISDCWKGYAPLKNDPDYDHMCVNHKLNFVDPETLAHTQSVESLWRNAKMRNKRHFGTHRHMLDSYLCEFLWRRQLKGKCPFESILTDIAIFWPPN